MQRLQLYRPNKDNTGSALSFNFGAAKTGEVSLYLQAVKQASWNAQTETGSFRENAENPEKKMNVKFSDWEVGGLIAAFRNVDRFSAYHTNDRAKSNTTVTVSPLIPNKVRDPKGNFVDNVNKVQRGFSIVLNRDKTLEFKVAVSFGEAATIVEYLSAGLREKFFMENAPAASEPTGEQQQNRQERAPQNAPTQQAAPQRESETSNAGLEEDVPF